MRWGENSAKRSPIIVSLHLPTRHIIQDSILYRTDLAGVSAGHLNARTELCICVAWCVESVHRKM